MSLESLFNKIPFVESLGIEVTGDVAPTVDMRIDYLVTARGVYKTGGRNGDSPWTEASSGKTSSAVRPVMDRVTTVSSRRC